MTLLKYKIQNFVLTSGQFNQNALWMEKSVKTAHSSVMGLDMDPPAEIQESNMKLGFTEANKGKCQYLIWSETCSEIGRADLH